MTLGQHKQDMLAGAPGRLLCSVGTTADRHGVQVMTLPVEPYGGSGSYCLGLGPPRVGCEGESGGRQMAEAGCCIFSMNISLSPSK